MTSELALLKIISPREEICRVRNYSRIDNRDVEKLDCCAWIAELDGQDIGFAIANKTEKTIFGIFVLPSYEGQGAGRCLMKAAENWLWSQPKLMKISLLTGNDPSLRAYGFFIFTLVGTSGGAFETNGDFEGEMKFIKHL